LNRKSTLTIIPVVEDKIFFAKRFELLIPFIGTLFFIYQSVKRSFVLTTPSDPLQYIQPALDPSNGFEFLDRTFLWLYFRLFAQLPISPELVGPIGTLVITSATLLLIGIWLSLRFGIVSGSIFVSISLVNPFLVSLSTYTYPTQLMTLVIVLSLILYSEVDSFQWRSLILGIGLAMAVFTKIQALGAVILFLIIFTIRFVKSRKSPYLLFYLLGLFLGGIFIFLTLVVLDGPTSAFEHFLRYFQGTTAKVQFDGQGGVGGFPPFYKYFSEPVYLLAILGCVLLLFLNRGKQRVFAIAAIAQMGSLLLIYLVTQRGGSLIHNYTFDFLILGVTSFSIVIGAIFNDLKSSYRMTLCASIFLISIVFNFYSSTHIEFIGQLGIGLPYSSLSWLSFISLTMFIFVGLKSKEIQNPRKRKKVNILFSKVQVYSLVGFMAMFFSVMGNVDRGYWDSTFKIYESQPYHALSKRVMTLSGNICIEVKLDRPDILDSGPRLRGVYNTFYARNGQGLPYINGLNSQGKSLIGVCDYYVTDFPNSSFQSQMNELVDGSEVVIADSDGKFVDSVEIPLRNVGL
jgi:hypothetical protein